MENTNSKLPARIYVPLWLGVSILAVFFVLAAAVGLLLYKNFAPLTLYNPSQEYQSLGSTADIKVSPGASLSKIADAVNQHINKETTDKLTIIFFYDGFATQKDALDAINVMQEALKDVEPFKSLQDLIATKIFTTDGQKCRAENNLLVCDQKLIDSFKKLGINHFKVVLVSPSYFIPVALPARGSNSFITFTTFNNTVGVKDEKRWMGIVFTQLLGKSLGLSSEYTNQSSIKEAPPPPSGVPVAHLANGKPNCAPDLATAQQWWGRYTKSFSDVGYNPGCGESKDHYYPVKNTLMSDIPQIQGYGRVSEDYLRGVLSCFYGGKEAIVFPTGYSANYSAELKSCDAFTKAYPKFWEE